MAKEWYTGLDYPTFITPQKRIFKIPINEERKLNFRTNVSNDFFQKKKGELDFNSNDLELLSYNLKDGLLRLNIKCLAKTIGRKDDIEVVIRCDNGSQLHTLLPLEVIEDEDAAKFNKPKIIPIGKDGWISRGWDEEGGDIAEVKKDMDGITVYYNSESQVWDFIKRSIRSDDILGAEKMYITQCYLQALHLYIEFKEDEDYVSLVRRSMKAFGKSLQRLIITRFRR